MPSLLRPWKENKYKQKEFDICCPSALAEESKLRRFRLLIPFNGSGELGLICLLGKWQVLSVHSTGQVANAETKWSPWGCVEDKFTHVESCNWIGLRRVDSLFCILLLSFARVSPQAYLQTSLIQLKRFSLNAAEIYLTGIGWFPPPPRTNMFLCIEMFNRRVRPNSNHKQVIKPFVTLTNTQVSKKM